MSRTVLATTEVEVGEAAVIVTEVAEANARFAVLDIVSPEGDESELELDPAQALEVIRALAPVAGLTV